MILLDISNHVVRMALPCPCYYIQCGRLRFANTPLHRAPHGKETLTIRAVTPAQAGVQTDVVSQKHWIPVCTGMTRGLVLRVSDAQLFRGADCFSGDHLIMETEYQKRGQVPHRESL